LLIDDEADVQYSFQRIFDSPEVELTTASSGEEGLRLIPKLKPDLVVMDVRMGGMSGLETLRRIRQIDSKLMVILMTAYGTTQMAIEAMKLGAYDYLLKPFDVPKLKELIANALKAARDMKQVVSYQPLLETEDYELGIVGRSEPMQQVFKVIAAYLGGSSDLSHLTPEDSRRFRALPAWMTLMAYGKAGYRELVARCCSLAQQMAQGIEQTPHFELLAPVRLDIVCFALRGANAAQRDQFLGALKEDGRVLLTPTFFAGKPAIRAAFVNWSTSEQDIPLILNALEHCASE